MPQDQNAADYALYWIEKFRTHLLLPGCATLVAFQDILRRSFERMEVGVMEDGAHVPDIEELRSHFMYNFPTIVLAAGEGFYDSDLMGWTPVEQKDKVGLWYGLVEAIASSRGMNSSVTPTQARYLFIVVLAHELMHHLIHRFLGEPPTLRGVGPTDGRSSQAGWELEWMLFGGSVVVEWKIEGRVWDMYHVNQFLFRTPRAGNWYRLNGSALITTRRFIRSLETPRLFKIIPDILHLNRAPPPSSHAVRYRDPQDPNSQPVPIVPLPTGTTYAPAARDESTQDVTSLLLLTLTSVFFLGPQSSAWMSLTSLPLLLHLATSIPSTIFLCQTLPLLSITSTACSLQTTLPLLENKAEVILGQLLFSTILTTASLCPILALRWMVKHTKWKHGFEAAVGFGMLWSTTWVIWEQLCPFGRYGIPSPLPPETQNLLPILRIAGPPGLDFFFGTTSYLVYLLANVIWPRLDPLLPLHLQSNNLGRSLSPSLIQDEQSQSFESTQESSFESNHWGVGTISLLLLLVSTFTILQIVPLPNMLSLSDGLATTTPFTIACVLPPGPSTDLNTMVYLSETLGPHARLLVWPENVLVTLGEERQSAIDTVVREVAKRYGVWVVMGLDTRHDEPGEKARKNEVVLVGPNGELGSYEKQKLVPLVESYLIEKGKAVAPIWDLDLGPPSYIRKPDWAPAPFTRPISLLPLICLDTFHPSLLPSPDHPGLLIIPASSPAPMISERLLAHAQQRSIAHSLPSIVCSTSSPRAGPGGGISAVFDNWGRVIYTQRGGGSFVVTLPLVHPERSRTPWEMLGSMGVLGIGWMLIGLNGVRKIDPDHLGVFSERLKSFWIPLSPIPVKLFCHYREGEGINVSRRLPKTNHSLSPTTAKALIDHFSTAAEIFSSHTDSPPTPDSPRSLESPGSLYSDTSPTFRADPFEYDQQTVQSYDADDDTTSPTHRNDENTDWGPSSPWGDNPGYGRSAIQGQGQGWRLSPIGLQRGQSPSLSISSQGDERGSVISLSPRGSRQTSKSKSKLPSDGGTMINSKPIYPSSSGLRGRLGYEEKPRTSSLRSWTSVDSRGRRNSNDSISMDITEDLRLKRINSMADLSRPYEQVVQVTCPSSDGEEDHQEEEEEYDYRSENNSEFDHMIIARTRLSQWSPYSTTTNNTESDTSEIHTAPYLPTPQINPSSVPVVLSNYPLYSIAQDPSPAEQSVTSLPSESPTTSPNLILERSPIPRWVTDMTPSQVQRAISTPPAPPPPNVILRQLHKSRPSLGRASTNEEFIKLSSIIGVPPGASIPKPVLNRAFSQPNQIKPDIKPLTQGNNSAPPAFGKEGSRTRNSISGSFPSARPTTLGQSRLREVLKCSSDNSTVSGGGSPRSPIPSHYNTFKSERNEEGDHNRPSYSSFLKPSSALSQVEHKKPSTQLSTLNSGPDQPIEEDENHPSHSLSTFRSTLSSTSKSHKSPLPTLRPGVSGGLPDRLISEPSRRSSIDSIGEYSYLAPSIQIDAPTPGLTTDSPSVLTRPSTGSRRPSGISTTSTSPSPPRGVFKPLDSFLGKSSSSSPSPTSSIPKQFLNGPFFVRTSSFITQPPTAKISEQSSPLPIPKNNTMNIKEISPPSMNSAERNPRPSSMTTANSQIGSVINRGRPISTPEFIVDHPSPRVRIRGGSKDQSYMPFSHSSSFNTPTTPTTEVPHRQSWSPLQPKPQPQPHTRALSLSQKDLPIPPNHTGSTRIQNQRFSQVYPNQRRRPSSSGDQPGNRRTSAPTSTEYRQGQQTTEIYLDSNGKVPMRPGMGKRPVTLSTPVDYKSYHPTSETRLPEIPAAAMPLIPVHRTEKMEDRRGGLQEYTWAARGSGGRSYSRHGQERRSLDRSNRYSVDRSRLEYSRNSIDPSLDPLSRRIIDYSHTNFQPNTSTSYHPHPDPDPDTDAQGRSNPRIRESISQGKTIQNQDGERKPSKRISVSFALSPSTQGSEKEKSNEKTGTFSRFFHKNKSASISNPSGSNSMGITSRSNSMRINPLEPAPASAVVSGASKRRPQSMDSRTVSMSGGAGAPLFERKGVFRRSSGVQ
ncbi:hypothetical protein M231_01123 [Tremella mesenterica]|uniref:CN hydrolase domain-containing protein n=1 Tax=Tremella mesenterica TaxID=5217 RepID=A0A4Q1BU51_TREME|nr:hypothetical protein M231_01123 [Tremella mesenterica]